MKKKKEFRLPRPFGATQMVNAYQKLPDEQKPEMKLKMDQFFIHTWFLSNGNLCGINYSINDLARFLNTDPSVVQIYMRDQVLGSRIWDQDKQREMMEALLGQQIAWTFEDRMEVQNQLEILKKSQNGRYAPFVTAEVNKALKLKLDTTASIQSLVRSFTGSQGSSINIFNQFNQQNNQQQEAGITQQEALLIIQEEQTKLPAKEKADKYIEAKYDLSDLPEVCALKQEGVNTEKEGLNLNKNELNQITDNYKMSLELAPSEFQEIEEELDAREHHDTRRQRELGEDLEEDDPEMKVYD